MADLGQRVEHRLAPHFVEVALQAGDVVARGLELLLEQGVGVLHAARFAEQLLRDRTKFCFAHVVVEVAARRLQRAGVGVGRGHRGIDRLVHRFDAVGHALGDARDALAGVGRLEELVVEPLGQLFAGGAIAEDLVDALIERGFTPVA